MIIKKYLHWFGSALGIVGIVFVAFKLVEYSDQYNFTSLTPRAWITLVLLSGCYGVAGLLLALSWRALLQYLRIEVTKSWAIRSYGISQLAKYIPGNIFHLAGRQAFGVKAGIPNWTLAKSSLGELCALSGCSVLFSLLAAPLILPNISVTVAVSVFLLIIVVLAAVLFRYVSRHLGLAFCYYCLFLVVMANVFVWTLVIAYADGDLGVSYVVLGGAYLLAWLAGMLTPGTPAGLGVRELALFLLLGHSIDHAVLVGAIVLSRLVSVVGDTLFFVIAHAFDRKQPRVD